jgi:ABC-type sugar transport system substrate-binding protein
MATGEIAMTPFTSREKLLAAGILLGSFVVPIMPLAAQEKAIPDFSSNNVGWVALNGNGPFFETVPDEVAPVASNRPFESLISATRT